MKHTFMAIALAALTASTQAFAAAEPLKAQAPGLKSRC